MANNIDPDYLLRGVKYNQKTSPQVRASVTAKVAYLEAKIVERQGRITRTLEREGISEVDYLQLMNEYLRDRNNQRKRATYNIHSNAPIRAAMVASSSNGGDDEVSSASPPVATGPKVVDAGTLSQLSTEAENIETEKKQIKRMKTLLKNLTDTKFIAHPQTGETIEVKAVHDLSDDDLEFLGFCD